MKFKFLMLGIVLFLPLLLSSYTEPYYAKLAQKLRSQHILEMQQQGFKISLIGSAMLHDVEEICLGFELEAIPDIDESRALFVHSVEKLLDRINNDDVIQPYLHNRPFTIDNLDYSLGFTKSPPSQMRTESIAYVYCADGKIFYCVYDESRATKLRQVYCEPYEEALRIVQDPETH